MATNSKKKFYNDKLLLLGLIMGLITIALLIYKSSTKSNEQIEREVTNKTLTAVHGGINKLIQNDKVLSQLIKMDMILNSERYGNMTNSSLTVKELAEINKLFNQLNITSD
jgi:hypothetical protein